MYILYYIILYYITLYYITLYYIILHYIILYYIILYHIISYYIISYYIMLYYIIYYIISYYIISYYIIYIYIPDGKFQKKLVKLLCFSASRSHTSPGTPFGANFWASEVGDEDFWIQSKDSPNSWIWSFLLFAVIVITVILVLLHTYISSGYLT